MKAKNSRVPINTRALKNDIVTPFELPPYHLREAIKATKAF
jgi:hypothetical protein